jgi:hypothetical protein
MRFPFLVALAAACGGSPDASVGDAPSPSFEPGEPFLLTPGSPAEDEDPSVLLAADGTLAVAFFSRRQGNADIYVTTTRDGLIWTGPARVTVDADDDFAPSLIQDRTGRFHLAWFRRAPAPTYYAHVRSTSTLDLGSWSPTDERRVTDATGYLEDWVPTLAETPDGRLVIVFVSRFRGAGSTYDLYSVVSGDGGDTWGAPVALDDVNDPAAHDHLPSLARTDAGLALAWVRCDTTSSTPWENPSADVLLATSTDGVRWTAPANVTHDSGILDVFPGLYRRFDGAWSLVWVSTATSAAGSVVDVPVAGVAAYPAGRTELPLAGYSPRIVATPRAGVYLGVTVQGATGAQDLYGRLFVK